MTIDPTYSFEYLKSKVSLAQVLRIHGLDKCLRQRGSRLVGPCPLHQGDHPTAFRADIQRGIWHCWTACGGGDVVELVRRIYHCDHAQAARWMRARATGESTELRRPAEPTSIGASTAFRPFTWAIPLDPRVPFLQWNKGISVETARRFEAGRTDVSLFLRGTVAVRLHDLLGNPLGYCGRHLEPESIAKWGKWRFPRSFPKSECLFGAHRALPHRGDSVVVVECPWAVMRLAQAGIPGAVALLGTQMSAVQAAWLSRAPRVVLLFDGDEAGERASRQVVTLIGGNTRVRVHDLPSGLEPEDLDDDALRSLVRPT